MSKKVPYGWQEAKIEDLSEVKGGFAFDSSRFRDSGKYQVIKMSNLYENILDLNRSQSFIDEVTDQENESLLNEGDIIITLTGTVGKRDYGYSFLITCEKNLLLNQRVARLRTNNIETKYFYYAIKSKFFLNQFFYSARGGTGNQANVGTNDLANIKILVPPPKEQTAIANLLSTWDTAINTLTQLITQKELRKKWLMQQLLTGKKRLKGFKEKWKEQSLGYFIQLYSEKPKSISGFVILTSAKAGLMRQDEYYGNNRIANRVDADYNVIPPNYLTYRSRSDDGLFTFNKNDLGLTGLISGYYPVFTIVNGDIDFVLMYMNYFKQKLSKYAIGTSQLVLTLEALSEAKFNLPDKGEQSAIANVLQSADAELNLLRQKLDKLKEQKKGLMQVLLTGKKRLNLNHK